jgi:hypothetical protein
MLAEVKTLNLMFPTWTSVLWRWQIYGMLRRAVSLKFLLPPSSGRWGIPHLWNVGLQGECTALYPSNANFILVSVRTWNLTVVLRISVLIEIYILPSEQLLLIEMTVQWRSSRCHGDEPPCSIRAVNLLMSSVTIVSNEDYSTVQLVRYLRTLCPLGPTQLAVTCVVTLL